MPIAEIIGKTALETAKETSKEVAKKGIDVSKRVDVGKTTASKFSGKVDINKRITPEKGTGVKDTAKELTSKQKNELTKRGMSPNILKDCKLLDGIFKLSTANEALAGLVHPLSGVSFSLKVIDLLGMMVEGVFPEFKSLFEVALPDSLLKASDKMQFSYCMTKLQDAIKNNSLMKSIFTPRQLEQIAKGIVPGGLVWHHSEEVGIMKLIDSNIHAKTAHTGGRAIWGGGKDNR